MYKIKQNMNFSLNLLISFALSGIFQVAALSQAQAKLSAGDFLGERMERELAQEEMIQSQRLEKKSGLKSHPQ